MLEHPVNREVIKASGTSAAGLVGASGTAAIAMVLVAALGTTV